MKEIAVAIEMIKIKVVKGTATVMKKRSKSENVKTFPLPELNGMGSGDLPSGGAVRTRPHLSGLGALNDGLYTGIDTDPFGSWTGVPTDDPDSPPIQDADDL